MAYSRKETYLAKLAGEEIELPIPVTREDYYLAKLCGVYEGEIPEPITRVDTYLQYVAINGGIGGGNSKKFGVFSEANQITALCTYTTL